LLARVKQVPRDCKETLDLKVHKANEVLLVRPGNTDPKERQDLQVHKAKLDPKERQDLQVHKANEVFQAKLDPKER
tara:strand:- start:876 stop:1103 length:228 start_codon:yes stop_codon:yes gene_type:complete